MRRFLFEKVGDGVWISHLDLMRLFQRAFRRGGMMLKHTQGFTPHAIVSIALPLSVGVESRCEILDFELTGEEVPNEEAVRRVNETLPKGVRVLECYDSDRKIKFLTHLHSQVVLEYDSGVPAGAEEAIGALFARESLTVEKKSKNGPTEVDLIPMLRSLEVRREDDHTLILDTVHCAQNPSLNPAQLAAAVCRYLPEFAPNFSKNRRLEVYDQSGEVFR